MYKLKSTPEDFYVKEISDIAPKGSGRYMLCRLKKKNYPTIRAIDHIANSLRKNPKDIGFAGTKDKIAITEQFITIKNAGKKSIENLNINDIELAPLGYTDEPLSLGQLIGNEFIITIRDINKKDIEIIENKAKLQKITMPNYFGKQRFSKNNIEIGKSLIKKDFKKALDIILSTNSDYEERLKELKNSPISALQQIPLKLLKLYVHAYQSYLWNKALHKLNPKKNLSLPILGFGTEFSNKDIEEIYDSIITEENISQRDFINKKLKEISVEGNTRDALVDIENLKILEKNKDNIKINFRLKKGSYATVAVSFLLNSLDTIF